VGEWRPSWDGPSRSATRETLNERHCPGCHLALEPGPRHRRNPHHHRNPRLVPHLGVRRHRIQRHRSRPTRRYRHRPNTAGGFSMPRFTYPKIAAVVLAVLTVFAGPASAKPGEAHFTPASTSHRYDGAHGIFTADAVYGPENKLFWSLRLSDSVRAIVVGPMACGATVEGKRGYGDHHPSVPADYQWHS